MFKFIHHTFFLIIALILYILQCIWVSSVLCNQTTMPHWYSIYIHKICNSMVISAGLLVMGMQHYLHMESISQKYWEEPYGWINSLWPGDAICWHISGSTLVQVMACCLMAPSHYLNPCWFMMRSSGIHLRPGNFVRDPSAINHLN